MESSQFVDLSKIPADEKPHIIELAVLHNALRKDVDLITGSSDEEKQTMALVFGYIRKGALWLHSRRFNVFFAVTTIYMVTGVLDRWGVKQETIGRLVEALIKMAEKAAV
jgi:hypothetical protein